MSTPSNRLVDSSADPNLCTRGLFEIYRKHEGRIAEVKPQEPRDEIQELMSLVPLSGKTTQTLLIRGRTSDSEVFAFFADEAIAFAGLVEDLGRLHPEIANRIHLVAVELLRWVRKDIERLRRTHPADEPPEVHIRRLVEELSSDFRGIIAELSAALKFGGRLVAQDFRFSDRSLDHLHSRRARQFVAEANRRLAHLFKQFYDWTSPQDLLDELKREYPSLIPPQLRYKGAHTWSDLHMHISKTEIDGLIVSEDGSGKLEVLEVKSRKMLKHGIQDDDKLIRGLQKRLEFLKLLGLTNRLAIYLPFGVSSSIRREIESLGVKIYTGLPGENDIRKRNEAR